MCVSVGERDSVCVCYKQNAGNIDSQGLQDLFPSPFPLPSPLWLSTFSTQTWQHVCVVCRSVFAYLLLHRYQSVGATWGDCRRHYLGDEHDHQPGGQQVRWWCGLHLWLLSFNLSVYHRASPVPIPVTSSLPVFPNANVHTDRLIQRTHSHIFSTHTVQMQAYSHPAWDHCSSCRSYMGGHVCHKCIGSWRKIALLP